MKFLHSGLTFNPLVHQSVGEGRGPIVINLAFSKVDFTRVEEYLSMDWCA